nr:hypothetical protein [uncultured Prevotella sp.]
MKVVIKIKNLIGTEVRSRISAGILRKQLDCTHAHSIDMEGVTFISRPFADELYNISLDYGDIHFLNMNDNVRKMKDTVWTSRNSIRKRSKVEGTIEDISTVEDLSKFFSTI